MDWATTNSQAYCLVGCCLIDHAFNQCPLFCHLSCDVASNFTVRNLVASQVYRVILPGLFHKAIEVRDNDNFLFLFAFYS